MFGALMWGNSFRLMRDDKISGLSKQTTYKDLCDLVQVREKLFHVPATTILAEIKSSLGELYSIKRDKTFYQQNTECTILGTINPYIADFSFAQPLPKEKLSVKYLWGATLDYSVSAKQLSALGIEDISSLTNFNINSIYWKDNGDSLEMYFGNAFQNITDGVVHIFSLRQPDCADITLDNYSTMYVDVLDTDMRDFAEIVCNRLRVN